MKYKAFIIRNLTNMHVGSGDNTFGAVDKLVQRDPVTNYPAIYSSSLKGALREFFTSKKDESFIQYVFGGEEIDSNNTKSSKPGVYRFFSANLIAIPVRSKDKPYYMATTPSILKEFLSNLKTFGIDKTIDKPTLENIEKLSKITHAANEREKVKIKQGQNTRIEDWDSIQNPNIPENITLTDSSPLSNIALFSEENFKELTNLLPIIARNNLENGRSTNLWYEEVVPREALFYFIVGEGEEHASEFEKAISSDVIQIGGNASIGYGFTKISMLKSNGEPKGKGAGK
ncbi:MAG: type III-B CRISPR module RAMP protein Cmr4 [Desulfamplus sp.]|nr:type III-B CRISPR module RAMP protein Cmr4 [Desulfamplus sp.]